VAAWLHDCGKVTTPEYVVDKATKLETIHDRIHEVRMRFEVLKRDAADQPACKAIADGEGEQSARAAPGCRVAADRRRLRFRRRLQRGRRVHGRRTGSSACRQIAGRTWLRTLDDRIGISQEEKLRKAATPAATLPVVEPLLADRPEHRFARPAR
jgi:hypothetical protein